MEQLDQLKTMRDQAAVRLEEARKAIETSPDAKLVSSLSSLITDLEQALGVSSGTHDEDNAAKNSKDAAELDTDKSASESVTEEDTGPIMEKIEKAAKKVSGKGDDLSLEESLEAELLSGDE